MAENELERPYDIELQTEVDNKRVPAHRSALLQCKHIKEMLEYASSGVGPLTIGKVDGSTLETLVRRCYKPRLHLTLANVLALLKAADYLQFDAAIDECCDFIKSHRSTKYNDWPALVQYSAAIPQLRDHMEKFVLNNFLELCDDPALGDLPLEMLVKFLDHDELNVSSEEDVLRAAALWCEHDPAERLVYAPDLMEVVRVTRLESIFIHKDLLCYLGCSESAYNAAKYWQENLSARVEHRKTKQRTPVRGNLFFLAATPISDDGRIFVERYNDDDNEWIDFACVAAELGYYRMIGFEGQLLFMRDVDFQGLDLTTLGSQIAPLRMSSERDHPSCAVMQGQLCVLGGHDEDGALDTFERWGPDGGWSRLTAMSAPRYGAAAIFEEDNLLLFTIGGENADGVLRSVECFNPFTALWEDRAPMNERRYNPGVAAAGGRIYVAGGRNEDRNLNTVEVYNFYEDSWTLLPPLSVIVKDVTCGFYKNRLWAVGCNARNVAFMEEYDPVRNSWSQKCKLFRRGAHQCTVCEGPLNKLLF